MRSPRVTHELSARFWEAVIRVRIYQTSQAWKSTGFRARRSSGKTFASLETTTRGDTRHNRNHRARSSSYLMATGRNVLRRDKEGQTKMLRNGAVTRELTSSEAQTRVTSREATHAMFHKTSCSHLSIHDTGLKRPRPGTPSLPSAAAPAVVTVAVAARAAAVACFPSAGAVPLGVDDSVPDDPWSGAPRASSPLSLHSTCTSEALVAPPRGDDGDTGAGP